MAVVSNDEILSVSQLNRAARQLLETGLPMIWVEGELSNLARPASGHIYFSLKDDQAQVRCAMFRSSNRRLKFEPDNGLQILLRARVSIYEPRGDYQLIVEHMEIAGEGLLRRRFEELKASLAAEGLFDEAHKLRLPAIPGRIGVITSPSGAAIRDILHVLRRRYPLAPIVLYPTRVQGAGAKEEISAALKTAAQRAECDVLILARGGGSLEDLWAFNEELVARSLYTCPIPTVSGIGHEIDFTIADLVADVRAPTPTAAAEIVVPDRKELLRELQLQSSRAGAATRRILLASGESLRQLGGRLARSHPGAVLQRLAQQLDDLTQKLVAELGHNLTERGWGLGMLRRRLTAASPVAPLQRRAAGLAMAQIRLNNAMRQRLAARAKRFAVAAAGLQAISPLATLQRGYAIVSDAKTGAVIRDAGMVSKDDRIEARLARGRLQAVVDKTRSD
jgi:exodeoxyribonuclease VII large subunit